MGLSVENFDPEPSKQAEEVLFFKEMTKHAYWFKYFSSSNYNIGYI